VAYLLFSISVVGVHTTVFLYICFTAVTMMYYAVVTIVMYVLFVTLIFFLGGDCIYSKPVQPVALRQHAARDALLVCLLRHMKLENVV
jgi:hypothetical protein